MRAIVTSQNFLDDITTGITTIVLRFSGHFRTTSQHLVIHGKLRSRILMNSDRPVISQLATGLLFRNYPWFEYEEEILTPPVNTQRVAGQAPSVKTENAEYCLLKPNPATGYVEVSYKVERSNCDDLRLTLYDARGRAILERNLERRKDDLMIDISTFASGLYSVVLRCKGKVIVQQKLQIIN